MGRRAKLLYRVCSGNEGPTPDWSWGGCSCGCDGAEDRTIIKTSEVVRENHLPRYSSGGLRVCDIIFIFQRSQLHDDYDICDNAHRRETSDRSMSPLQTVSSLPIRLIQPRKQRFMKSLTILNMRRMPQILPLHQRRTRNRICRLSSQHRVIS